MLDVNLNLENGTFSPYIKPGDTPQYVHSKSNHPPSILKNIPLAVKHRLSEISSNEDIFKAAAPIYQNELDKNGYKHILTYEPPKPKNNRPRNKTTTSGKHPQTTTLKA